jgi:hypothetical protein
MPKVRKKSFGHISIISDKNIKSEQQKMPSQAIIVKGRRLKITTP